MFYELVIWSSTVIDFLLFSDFSTESGLKEVRSVGGISISAPSTRFPVTLSICSIGVFFHEDPGETPERERRIPGLDSGYSRIIVPLDFSEIGDFVFRSVLPDARRHVQPHSTSQL